MAAAKTKKGEGEGAKKMLSFPLLTVAEKNIGATIASVKRLGVSCMQDF